MLSVPLLLAVTVSACGDSGSSEAQQDEEAGIEALGERFERIVRAKDAKAFCAILAPTDVHRLGEGKTDGSEECLVVWGESRNPLFQAADAELEIESVALEGFYATAELANGGELSFAKEEGDWYVHLSPGAGQAEGAAR